MTEAMLIEIEHRFRRLEDIVEGADLFHAEIRLTGRDDLENALEACRRDMTAMQEQIRDMTAMQEQIRKDGCH